MFNPECHQIIRSHGTQWAHVKQKWCTDRKLTSEKKVLEIRSMFLDVIVTPFSTCGCMLVEFAQVINWKIFAPRVVLA